LSLFTIKNGKARERNVTIGHQNGLAAEIISGLSEGEEVILYPDKSIRDGTKVKKR